MNSTDYEKLRNYLSQPEYSSLSDEEAALALANLTIEQPRRYVFGSFRTIASLLTMEEYNTLRAVFKAAVAQEAVAGGSLYGDMEKMLLIPGDEDGRGGGLDFNNESFITAITGICQQAEIPNVPGKISAYCETFQSAPTKVFPVLSLYHISFARGNIQ
jgi:hypothetical protein